MLRAAFGRSEKSERRTLWPLDRNRRVKAHPSMQNAHRVTSPRIANYSSASIAVSKRTSRPAR